jgi:hypothetical protein
MDTEHWWIIAAQYEVKVPEVVLIHNGDYYSALEQLNDVVARDERMKIVRQLGLFVLAAKSESGSYNSYTSYKFYPGDLDLAQPWKK